MESSTILEGDHFEFFISKLRPIDDNLDESINAYKKIKLEGEKHAKNVIDIKKIIDDLEKRKKAYKLFEKN